MDRYITMAQTAVAYPDGDVKIIESMNALQDFAYVVNMRDEDAPTVATSPGLNIDKLLMGDTKPTFITLPILEVGRLSGNGLIYDEQLVSSLFEQILTKHPGAIQGHVPIEARMFAFPIPVGIWVGARRIDNLVWGKAYLFPGEFADYVNRLDGVNKRMGTSIYGTYGEKLPVKGMSGAYTLDYFELDTLDFAPPTHAALQFDKKFSITSETKESVMVDEDKKDKVEDTKEEKDEKKFVPGKEKPVEKKPVAEMSESEVGSIVSEFIKKTEPKAVYEMLPATHQKACAEMYCDANGMSMGKNGVIKMTAAETLDGITPVQMEALVKTSPQFKTLSESVATMQNTLAEYRKREISTNIDEATLHYLPWKVTSEKSVAVHRSLRDNMRNQIIAEMSVNKNDVSDAARKVWDNGFDKIAKVVLESVQGGNAVVGNSDKETTTFATADEQLESLSRIGW